ncbi:MAG: hypothetical protein K2X07_04410 [Caulobacteraceae bacterium]|nr:hypothetical protein [Caulobacteraceae bacterium]
MAFALHTGVAAQDTNDGPTASQIAAARNQADRVVEAAKAADVFENATVTDIPAVRHRQSGLRCLLIGDQGADSLRADPVPGLPRGDDVSCASYLGPLEFTLYFTRYPDQPSAEDDMDLAVGAILRRLPDAKPHTGELPIASSDLGEPLWAGFDIVVSGREMFTFVAVQKHGPWMVKVRATGPRNEAEAISTLASLLVVRAPD